MNLALLTALALVGSCFDSGTSEPSPDASAADATLEPDVVRIDPYAFDGLTARLFRVTGAVRVRASGTRNETKYELVLRGPSGDEILRRVLGSHVHLGELDSIVVVEFEGIGIGADARSRVFVRSASHPGSSGGGSEGLRYPMSEFFPTEIGVIRSGFFNSSRTAKRGDAIVLREWTFESGKEARRLVLEMTVGATD